MAPIAAWDVVIAGGGNAALCAALEARAAGARVLLLESAPRAWRGGNSVHVRNIRCAHDVPEDVLLDAYTTAEYWDDLRRVTKGNTEEALARQVIDASASTRPWMRAHGVHFQPALSGTLHVARTNAFLLGGGKALVNAYYRAAERLGVDVRYEHEVLDVEFAQGNDGRPRFVALLVRTPAGEQRIAANAAVLACGGFESNREWLREAWGRDASGDWIADAFLIRGTRFNQGHLLRRLLDAGADGIGDPTQCHCVAIDARAPLYDGGICTRIDCVSLGIVVDRNGARFYDEGEDFWPKRYAVWGRLVAAQPGQIGYAIIDAKPRGRFMPPVFPGIEADDIETLAGRIGVPAQALAETVEGFNRACRAGTFDHTTLDDCATVDLQPRKSHWARPLDTPPFTAYPLRPGITFTYLGLRTDAQARVFMRGEGVDNLFVAGELMAGNILGEGYLAGIGMTIGTAFGRIAGQGAAECVRRGH